MPGTKSIHEVIFEERDIQIFRIPDIKTRLSTLQNYFFPRLEMLLRHALEIVAEVYGVNPYERMTFVYCPNHRQKAKENIDFGIVHIGVAAKRGNSPLQIIKSNGQPFFFHPTYLTFKVSPRGTIHVELLSFRQLVDDNYVSAISALVKNHSAILAPLLSLANISHRSDFSCCELRPLYQAISPEEIGNGIKLISPKYYFPVDSDRGLSELILAFTLLYALAESFICIGEGRKPELKKMLMQFRKWYRRIRITRDKIEVSEKETEFAETRELDSYSFVRVGKW